VSQHFATTLPLTWPRPSNSTAAPRSVGEVFTDERPRLLALPERLSQTDRVEPVQVDTQAFVRVDTKRDSVPTDHAGHVRTLVVDDRTVRVVDGESLIAEHARCWGRRQIIEQPAHRTALITERKQARDLKGRDRLRAIAPTFDRIIERWAVSGPSLGLRVTPSIKLLDLYGDEVFAAAVGASAAI
jgi:hypothetical protein